MTLSTLLTRDLVITDLPSAERDVVVREVVKRLVELDKIPERSAKTVVKGILEREAIGSTGIGRGIAIPHTKTRVVEEPVVAFVRLPEPIPYGSTDGAPVHSLFFVISPLKDAEKHVAILRWVSVVARSDYYTRILSNTRDPDSLHSLFREIDGTA